MHVILLMIIFTIVTAFMFFSYVEFIKPSVIQIQLLGMHLTIFGGFFLLYGDQITGFVTILLGLAIGVYGSFKDSNAVNQTDGKQDIGK